METCGHVQFIQCHEVENWKCKEPCERNLECDHLCTRTCGEDCLPQNKCENPCKRTCIRSHPCTLKCSVSVCECKRVVTKTMPDCKHEQEVLCAEYEQWQCKEPCERKLECDHSCTRTCGEDCLPRYLCEEPCNRTCSRGHPCTLECSEDDCECEQVVTKTMPDCKHEQEVPCAEYEEWQCKRPCEKTLRCGHRCPKKCSKVCERKIGLYFRRRFCLEQVEITLPECEHKVTIPCKDNPELNEMYKTLSSSRIFSREEKIYPKCPEKCSKLLTCGHQCANKCRTCEHNEKKRLILAYYRDRVQPCTEQCNKELDCGHRCQELCSDPCKCEILLDKTLPKCGHEKRMKCCDDPEDVTCDQACSRKLPCDHPCRNRCRDPCQTECKEMVTKPIPKCGHEVMIQCGSKLTNIRCKKQCIQKLTCGHSCKNKCYEKCTSKCKFKVEKSLDCGHKKQAECWVEKESIKCTKKCTKKLTCGHVRRGVCSKPCDTQCTAKKKITMPECRHVVFIQCHQSAADVACTGSCKKKLPCGHKCRNQCGEPCEPKCQAAREEIMKDCQHRQKVLCQVDVKDHICQVACKKRLQCGHPCAKRCGERCCCGKSRVEKLPRCGHMQTIECERKASDHTCQSNCRRKLRCGHKCANKCGEPCVTRCNQGQEIVLRKCKHKQMIPCHIRPKDFKCTVKCKKKLSCGHHCQQICGETCTEKCQEEVKRKLLKCNHRQVVKCSDDIKGAVCEIRCSKKLSCGHKCAASCGQPCTCNEKCPRRLPCLHWCKERCGEPCTKTCDVKVKKTIKECGHQLPKEVPCHVNMQRADCKSVCGQRLACEHTCSRQCSKCTGHANRDQMESCRKTCNTLLQCGHRCRAACHECFEGRLHMPCKLQCQLILLCGCECQRQCKLCMRSCSCKKDHRKTAREVSNMDSTNPGSTQSTNKRQSASFSKEPCEKKLECGHGCIGLSGEPCIKLCKQCDRGKLKSFFPGSQLGKDSCYIKLTPCGHIAEITSLTKEFGISKGCHPVTPICCPKCEQIANNERFLDIQSDWTKDVHKIKTLVDAEGQTYSTKADNLQVPAAVYAVNFPTYIADSSIWKAEIAKEESSLKSLLNDVADTADTKDIIAMSKLKITKTFKAVNKAVGQQAAKKSASSHLNAQVVHDVAHELCRMCCWFDIFEFHVSKTSTESCSKPPSTFSALALRIVEEVSTTGKFTEKRYRDVQRRIEELRVELSGKEKWKNPHSMSLPIQKLCPVGFHMGDWFKCPEGHYFSRSQCQSGQGAKKVNLACPICIGKKTTAVVNDDHDDHVAEQPASEARASVE